jgi:hypothetical protein
VDRERHILLKIIDFRREAAENWRQAIFDFSFEHKENPRC